MSPESERILEGFSNLREYEQRLALHTIIADRVRLQQDCDHAVMEPDDFGLQVCPECGWQEPIPDAEATEDDDHN